MIDKATDLKTAHVEIGGMHCANCEVLIERRFRDVSGVVGVLANRHTGRAEVQHLGPLDIEALRRVVHDDGYTVSYARAPDAGTAGPKNTARDYIEIGAALLIVLALYSALCQFDILPTGVAVPSSIGYGLAFLIGAVASISTCMAVTGGLLVAVAAKYNELNPGSTAAQRFKPHLYFNAGRLMSYAVLGAAIGALGSALMLSQEANGIIVIAVSVLMVVLGLQMLRLFPRFRLLPLAASKRLSHRIHELAAQDAKGGAFLLGAATFFLPCGFTQALQLYVLAQGDALTGALVMLSFALGTLPALLSLSALASLAKASVQRHFLKFAGVAVVLLGLFNIQNGLTLTGARSGDSAAILPGAQQTADADEQVVPIVDGKQVAKMKIIDYGYEPHRFVVKQGVPVQWQIDAQDAAGCGLVLIAPKARVRTFLSPRATNIISFTPQEVGDIAFNCGMGMMTPGSKFIVVPNARS